MVVLRFKHSRISKTLQNFWRGTKHQQPSGIAAAKDKYNKHVSPTDLPGRTSRPLFPRRAEPARAGEPCPCLAPRSARVPQPGRPDDSAATWAATTALAPRARPPDLPPHLPGPRVRAATDAAPERQCRGPRCRAPAVRASPALPQAANRGAQRQEAAPLKPVSAAPDQTARPLRGAGPEKWRGGDWRHARRRWANGRPRAGGGPARSWKGPASEAEGGRASPRYPALGFSLGRESSQRPGLGSWMPTLVP